MIKRDSEKKNSSDTVKTYFPNGILYSSVVYENDKVIKCTKYHTSGKLAQVISYLNGKIIAKEQFNRVGDKGETYSYEYDEQGLVQKIIREKTNSIDCIIFEREDFSQKITKIYVKHNNIVIRRLQYEYKKDEIICVDADYDSCTSYRLNKPPIADEHWFDAQSSSSLVMRKLRTALELSA